MSRLIRAALRCYPAAWRARYRDELADLTDELIARHELSIVSAAAELARAGLYQRLRLVSRRRWAVLGCVVALVGSATAVHFDGGRRPVHISTPRLGTMPHGRNVPYDEIPAYIAVSTGADRAKGYVAKAYVEPRPGAANDPLMGEVAPVYARNLTTLIGHLYPGIGFVPLGTSPWTAPCRGVSESGAGPRGMTTVTIPCQSKTFVLPYVVGTYTPTGVGRLSGLGVGVVVVNVPTHKLAPGHILSISPPAGTIVHARQPVIVDNAVAESFLPGQ